MIHSSQKEVFYYKLWFGATMVLGLIMIVLVPPFHSPDEFNHFYKAYHIADGHYISDFDSTKSELGGYIPRSLITVSKPFSEIAQFQERKMSLDTIFQYLRYPLMSKDKIFVRFPNTARYAPTAYAPQVLAIFILKKWDVPPLWMTYMGRFFTFMGWLWLISLSIRWTPVAYRPILMVITLLPESLAINTTLNADVVTNGFLFLQIGLFLQLKTDYKNLNLTQIRQKLLLFSFLVLLSTWHKVVYFPMLFLLLLLDKSIFDNNLTKKCIFVGLNLALNLLLIKVWSSHLHQLIYPFADLTQNTYREMRPGYNINPDLQVQYILHHPIEFLEKFIPATFSSYSHTNQSYIATFGWELIRLPEKVVIGFLTFFLAFVALQPIQWARVERILMLLIAHSMTSLFILSMYLHWDSVGDEVTDIYTAKYYFAPYALILLVLGGSFSSWKSFVDKKKYMEIVFNISFVVIWVWFLFLVYERYYKFNF
ncbi:MAG: hypothetical protein RIS64_1944 [Bacteroidota bacterium]|jgi:uncharacterized membrane protein